jgi:gamma-glutamyltranspeptidase/glutathione hydrolase
MRDPIGALVELAEREAAIAGHNREAIGRGVGHEFEEVGEVELHPRNLSIVIAVSVWLDEARAYPNGVVATPHYLASNAGAAMLAAGGNAIDAAVAANLVLAIVTPYMCGFGGDLLSIVWDGKVNAYRGVGRAPAGSTPDAVRAQSGQATMPTFGPHPCTVPGAIDGWFTMLEKWGTRSFGEVATRALQYAEDGFPATRRGAWFFARTAQLLDYFDLPDFHTFYGDVEAGTWIRQPEVGRLIRLLADDGPDAYYRGPVGAAIAERIQEAGGFMTSDDVATHTGAWVEPLRAEYRGVDVLEMPPPTQGVTALEAMRIADGLDLGVDSADREHLLIEAMKCAFADRHVHLGDPGAMTIDPNELLAPARIDHHRATIDPKRANAAAPYRGPDGGTIYMCTADRDGLLVSLIQSNFASAGCGLRVHEWGINLHNRGSAFNLDDGHPNAIGPGKMPLHTLIPALALRAGRPWLVFGTEGGHGQAQTHLQILTRMLVDGDDPQRAISAPRFTIDPENGRVAIEDHMNPAWVDDLRSRGHEIDVVRGYRHGPGIAHAIECLHPGYRAASDPRAEGGTAGV